MMYLSQDIRSALKPTTIYGKRGDCVNVISYHGSVVIVENVQGDRFPMMAELLTGKMNSKIEPPEILEKQPEPKTPAKKKVKVVAAGSSLF